MVAEILDVLAPQPGEIALDCTLGYGGHARELLAAVQPLSGGRLLGMDVDPLELPKTEARLRELEVPEESLIVRRMNYAGALRFVAEFAPEGVDVILADLGLSSMQIDNPERGFTFKADGPLDMRMNPGHGQSAAALLARLGEDELADLLVENADEPHSARIAEALVEAAGEGKVTTTQELTKVVRKLVPESSADDTVRRVFQALRIAVNDEFGALNSFLRTLPTCLKPGGRVAIITFHSGEDRRVKHAFKAGLQSGVYSKISNDVIRASMQEQHDNPRSSSAKLRFAVRSSVEAE
jgi:16S rRNA (cytosine1402-N4)-methyltransferase